MRLFNSRTKKLKEKIVAGTGGLEPPTYDTKNRCSTTELRPKKFTDH